MSIWSRHNYDFATKVMLAKAVHKGVHQGSTLGPLLFSAYHSVTDVIITKYGTK